MTEIETKLVQARSDSKAQVKGHNSGKKELEASQLCLPCVWCLLQGQLEPFRLRPLMSRPVIGSAKHQPCIIMFCYLAEICNSQALPIQDALGKQASSEQVFSKI